MPKSATHVVVTGLDVDRRRPVSLASQLYESLRQAILTGQLRAGDRLPSTRQLAEQLSVSRNTTTGAYDQLLAEGYIDAKVGSGTCVARSLPDELLRVDAGGRLVGKRAARRRSLSQRGKMLSSKPVRILTVAGRPQPFASGLPDLQMFPFATWARLMARHWRRPGYSLVGYGDPAGYKPLREAIAAYLRQSRAVRCDTEQVVIVTGSQQALDISARLLLDSGDTALLEDPGYPGARVALAAAGANLMRLPVDQEGADISGIADGAAQVAFVTPSHQFPLGVTMSVARRLALLEWAQRSGAWVLEDDYDSEYRYRGKPLPSLQGLDGAGRVIYVGSFSKTIFPSLRLGFLVLPADLVEPFRRAHGVIDGHSPVTEQAVLADFIADGHYARHIRRMRAVYEERQQALVEAAGRELQGLLEVSPSEGGMHLVGWLPEGVDDVKAAGTAAAAGVFVRALSTCAVRRLRRGGLILGYAALSIPQIREGVKKLAEALGTA